jgi:hypothetical protein
METMAKRVLLLLVIVSVVVGWGWWRFCSPQKGKDVLNTDQGLLGRPLRVSVVSWPGYAGGIVANNGFKPTKSCIFWNNEKLLVELILLEDVDARAKAFARGGENGIDIMYSTVDFWANEGVGFSNNGVDARAIMQVDWSRGGDAIVVDKGISRIEDLKDKKISLALFTPSHWLLEYSLENSGLSEPEREQIVKGLIGKNSSTDARTDFVAGKVDAAVVWEPDVTEALQKRPGSHVLVSTKEHPKLIADIMIAKEDFINQHSDVIRAFIRGWLQGTEEANKKQNLVVDLLMKNEPLYRDLGESVTRNGLGTVKWADLSDNIKMFGVDGSEAIFDRIFAQAGRAWIKRGYIKRELIASQARDDRFIREMHLTPSPAAQQATPK